MTDVADVEDVKFQLAVTWERTAPELKNVFNTLFGAFPGDVISALTAGQVTDTGDSATIDAWLGSSPMQSAVSRRPMPAVSDKPTWAPHHPSKNEDVEITWMERNPGADLGAYTNLVEVFLTDEEGEEKLKEIRVDAVQLGGNGSETATRSVTVSAPRDGELRLNITVNEEGATDTASVTDQGFQSQMSVTLQVGGADDKPSHGDHRAFVDDSAARGTISGAMESLEAFMLNTEGGELAAQQFGAGLYLFSYISEAFPRDIYQLKELFAEAHWFYDEGSKYYSNGEYMRMFRPPQRGDRSDELSLNTTKSLASSIVQIYSSFANQVGAFRSDPNLAASQIITSMQTMKSLIVNASD